MKYAAPPDGPVFAGSPSTSAGATATFTSRFRHELGITPKVLARMMRFRQFVCAAKRGAITTLADAALRYEYFDQSHLHRDARQFAGATPGELLKAVIPDDGGFLISSASLP